MSLTPYATLPTLMILEQEGVLFDDNDRVDFKRFGWPGPDEPY